MRFKVLVANLAVFGMGLGLVSCVSSEKSPAPSGDKPKVVVSYSVLCDLTQQIAQETIDLKCLIPAGQDPHIYQPTPADRKSIDGSRLVLYGGYDFEPSVIKILQATDSKIKKVAVNELAVPKPLKGESHADHAHHHDHDKADSSKAEQSNQEADPHVWHSAKNGVAIVQVLQTQLTEISPQYREQYAKNANALRDRLTKIDGWIQTSIATIPAPSRKLVTTHDALSYYSEAYGLPIEGALQGLSTDEKPTATRLKALIDQVKTAQVPTIFAEATTNPKLIETIARESNTKVSQKPLFADGLGESSTGAETYEKMLIWNTEAIVTGLNGKLPPKPIQY